MGAWDRLKRAGRSLLQRESGEALRVDLEGSTPAGEAGGDPPAPGGLSNWVEDRAERVLSRVYESRAEELEERALRVVSSAYERTADDMEERAVRAMRRAIEAEAEQIRTAIEHGIAVKKREVRLSLLVLVVSSLVYLALYWFTSRPS